MDKVDKEAWFDVSFKMKARNCKEIYPWTSGTMRNALKKKTA